MRAGDGNDIIAKIADFGCAISSSVAYYAGGTPTWMAPEQLLVSSGVSETIKFRDVERWDVYSFGIMVWYIFAAGKTDMTPRNLEFVTEARLKHDPMDLTLDRIRDSLNNVSWNDESEADASYLAWNCIGRLVRHDPLRRDLGLALNVLDRYKSRQKVLCITDQEIVSATDASTTCHREDLLNAFQEGYFEVYRPDSRIARNKLLGEDFTLFLERLSRRLKVAKVWIPFQSLSEPDMYLHFGDTGTSPLFQVVQASETLVASARESTASAAKMASRGRKSASLVRENVLARSTVRSCGMR